MDRETIYKRAGEYVRDEQNDSFKNEVKALIESQNDAELEDRFYQSLEFGTGGLRGVIGGGTNRMNTYMINRATQGLANYIRKAFPEKAAAGTLSAAVAYDSRRYSDVFAEATALILAANGFTAYLFTGLRPTPELSFAVRKLGCDTGVVVTASHNPPQYNGYKAYWSDGAQVTEPHDEGIIREVNAVTEVKTITRVEAVATGKLVLIDKEIDDAYHAMVKSKLFRPDLIKEKAGEVSIVYTPLHGTGAMHVEAVLGGLGLEVKTVPEQREPDGDFPTVEKPNPEEAPALKMALALAEKEKADVVMATDPDADRFGSAVPGKDGKFALISGNQMGVLLADYIILSRKELGSMPADPIIVRSIVTSTMTDRMAAKHNIALEECLTGFKWIAACMRSYEERGGHSYIFGFEESYGYNVETEVRDKDGVSAAAMCAEMTLYWRAKGKSLLERLEELYAEYGYFEDRAISKSFPGMSGGETMKNIMATLRRDGLRSIAGKRVVEIRDVAESVRYDPAAPGSKEKITLPKSNVLQFFLEGGSVVSARPSGTEPKIKFYINIASEPGGDLAEAKKQAAALGDAIEKEIHSIIGDAG